MSNANINAVFYADTYHPIQAGSIDGTDTLPHDNAVYRAVLCSAAGLCEWLQLLYLLPLSLRFVFASPRLADVNSWFGIFQMTRSAIPRLSVIPTARSSSGGSRASPMKKLYERCDFDSQVLLWS